MSDLSLFCSPRVLRGGNGRRYVCVVLAAAFGVLASGAWAAPVCKPKLAIHDARLSEMTPPSLERRWIATVTADASQCMTTAGYFELGVRREKESSLDLEFREQFIWFVPSGLISLDFAADEAVGSYWVDSVQECPCAKR